MRGFFMPGAEQKNLKHGFSHRPWRCPPRWANRRKRSLTAGPLEPCGHLTAKDFSKFHGLLLGAVATIFGQRA
jgi:hypothetical protein